MNPSPLLHLACALAAAGGVALAVFGMMTLSLLRIMSGAVLWLLGILAWEGATGRFP